MQVKAWANILPTQLYDGYCRLLKLLGVYCDVFIRLSAFRRLMYTLDLTSSGSLSVRSMSELSAREPFSVLFDLKEPSVKDYCLRDDRSSGF